MSDADVITKTVIIYLTTFQPKESYDDSIYTNDIEYIRSTTIWEQHARKKHAYDVINEFVPKNDSLIEVGCASGVSGCHLLADGYTDLTFCDFSGVGLEFIQYVLPLVKLSARIALYGQEGIYDWVIALDVIEHVPNPLSFLRWVYNIGRIGVISTYPETVPWQPPYMDLRVDEYVDTEMIIAAIVGLFEIVYNDHYDGGRLLVLRRTS